MKRKLFAILMSLTLVLTYIPAMAFADSEDMDFTGNKISGGTLALDSTKSVDLSGNYEYCSFDFTAPEEGWYSFESSGEDIDTIGRVLDEEGNENFNDDGGEGNHFLINFYAEQGSSYELQAATYDGVAGSFDVSLTAVSEGWWVDDYYQNIYYGEGADEVMIDADEWWSYTDQKPVLSYAWYVDNAAEDEDYYDWMELDETSASIFVPAETNTYKCVLTEDETGLEDEIIFHVRLDGDDGGDDYAEDFGDLPDVDTIDVIKEGTPVNTSVSPQEPIVSFQFTPQVSGLYVFESYGNADVVGCVRTEDEIIETMDDAEVDGKGYNFQIVFDAEAGTTYYLQAKGYSNENLSFQVKAYYAVWMASADITNFNYSGRPVTLEVVIRGSENGLRYNWYNGSNQLIRANGTKTFAVTAADNYHCNVSDGKKSVNIYFNVRVSNIYKNGFGFGMLNANSAYVYADWDEYDNCMLKGAVSIPATVSGFADSKTRTVTELDDFWGAREMTSVTIPSTVRTISEAAFVNTGLKNITIPATVTFIGSRALGYTYTFDEATGTGKYTKVPGFVIFGRTGSAAQKYAAANGFTFRDPAAEAAKLKRDGVADSKIPKVKIKKPAAKKNAVTVKWTKLNKKQLKKSKATKYEVWVSTSKSFPAGATTKEVFKSKGKSSATVKGLKKNTKYFVKVRAVRYAGGVKYVGKWSSVKSIKTKK